MISTEKKFESLIDRLLDRTKKGNAAWGMSFQNKPEIDLGTYSVRLDNGENPDGEPLEYIMIVDMMDEVLDRVSDKDLSSGYWSKMGELRKLANREARGINSALDSILENLDEENT